MLYELQQQGKKGGMDQLGSNGVPIFDQGSAKDQKDHYQRSGDQCSPCKESHQQQQAYDKFKNGQRIAEREYQRLRQHGLLKTARHPMAETRQLRQSHQPMAKHARSRSKP